MQDAIQHRCGALVTRPQSGVPTALENEKEERMVLIYILQKQLRKYELECSFGQESFCGDSSESTEV